MHRTVSAFVAALIAVGVFASVSLADSRPFTFTYDSSVMPKGAVEYEQWITWKADKDTDSSFDRFDIRHEIEFGVTDRFQLAIYASDWRYEDGKSVSQDRATWKNVAVEGIYNLTSATTDPIGSAIYGEVKFGDEKAVLETKLLLDKIIGNWHFGWNGTFEAEWEGSDYEEDKLELASTFGVSYTINPNWRVGAELIHEITYEDWSHWGDHVVYIGPNVGYSADRWWITITPTVQVTDVSSEANFMTRMLFGIFF